MYVWLKLSFAVVSSLLPIFNAPAWWFIISRAKQTVLVDDSTIGAVARTNAAISKAEQLKKTKKGLGTVFTRPFLINVICTIWATALLLSKVVHDGEVKSFDPFSILGIDSGADKKTIQKAFRTLSLQFHPETSAGDRVAETKFMMVAKAYEALTDEIAKENYEQYGNPDGKESLEVSIGLPSFLLEGNYRYHVLVTYLIIMVGVIPYCVSIYYSDSSKFGENDVLYDTYSWYHHALDEHTVVKQLPEVLAGSAEFRQRNMPKDPNEKSTIAQVTAQVRSCVKGNVLLHAYLLRKESLINSHSKEDLRYMLEVSTALLDAMISVCKHQNALATAAACIEFGQYVTQAIWVKESPLLQLPHFSTEELKHVLKAKTPAKTIQQYREIPDDQKKGMANFTEDQKNDVAAFLKMFPDITVTTRVYVDDDEDDNVYEGDLCTAEVVITRNNLEKGEKVGLVHAPHFPFPKQEAFWIILGQMKDGKIISFDKVTTPTRVVKHQIKFMAPPVGKYEFDLLVKSNAYVGMDETHKVTLETQDNSVLPVYKIHPNDAELDDEPTLFEKMLNAHIEQDHDDEHRDDDNDDEVDEKRALRRSRHDNDDSDDDGNAEEVFADK